jgi:hypothetical protein
VATTPKQQAMRSTAPAWCVVFCLFGCGGDARTPPTQPETPGLDGGSTDPTTPSDPGTDTGEPVGPLAAAPPGGGGSSGGSGGFGAVGGLGAVGGKSRIGNSAL